MEEVREETQPRITDATHVLVSREDAARFLMSAAAFMAVPRDQENPKPPEPSRIVKPELVLPPGLEKP